MNTIQNKSIFKQKEIHHQLQDIEDFLIIKITNEMDQEYATEWGQKINNAWKGGL